MKNKRLRLEGIKNILKLEEKTTLNELAVRFNVSTATIRRDIKLLEKSGHVYHGKNGEVFYHKDYPGPTREVMLSKFINEKVRIAEYCSTLIKERETIIVGPGILTMLAGRIFGGLDFQFRVITNSLPLALELSELKNISLFMIGGEVEKQYSTINNHNKDLMACIQYADKLFMTADGIDPEYGLTYFESSRIPVMNAMMNVAREIILIADSSKFGNVCFHFLDNMSRVHKIITDDKINSSIKKTILSEGIELVIV